MPLEGLAVVLVALAVLAGLVHRLSRKPARPRGSDGGGEALSSYRRRARFFTAAEAAFYHQIRAILPGHHTVFAKVRLCDLVDIAGSGSAYYRAFGRISQKHVDFVLCNARFAPYLVIELDGWSHTRERQQRADATKDEALKAAGLPILRLRVRERWEPSELEARLRSALGGGPPLGTAPGAAVARPASPPGGTTGAAPSRP